MSTTSFECKGMAQDILSIQRRVASINDQLKGGHSIDSTLIEQLQMDIGVVLEVVCLECEADPEQWESNSMMLVEAISDYNGLVITCLKKIDAIKDENTKIKAALISLKDKINALEEEVKQLSIDRDRLVLGQVAFEIERAIVSSILDKHIGPNHYINGIEDMERAIRGVDSNYVDVLTEEKKRVADKRWRDLQQALNWYPQHFRYMKSLKWHRISAAHPKINVAKVEVALKNGALPESETKVFNELFAMYKILKPEE